MKANRNAPNTGGWQDRHDAALQYPDAFEAAIIGMCKAWELYAAEHYTRYESLIGYDCVLGSAWEEMGLNIRTLLNGECGRLDCGTLDRWLLDTLVANGVDISDF